MWSGTWALNTGSARPCRMQCSALNAKLLLLLLPGPLEGLGAWQKTMKPQKPGNSPGPGLEVAQRKMVVKERVAQRVCNWTVHNKIRDVLGRMPTSDVKRILDSANPREITEGCVRCRENDRGGTSSLVETEGACVSKSLHQTVRKKRRVDTRDKRRETTRDCRGYK